MRPIYYLIPLCAGLLPLRAGATLNEPLSSAMAEGHWVKIRVSNDAIYELTYDELKSLGFTNPERVNVYGYNPTLLLTHNDNKIPADMGCVYTMHFPAYNKIMFYGKGDTDFAPELWEDLPSSSTTPSSHSKHAYSKDATYFLSDIDRDAMTLSSIPAPESATELNPVSEHTSLVYHEDEITNRAEGGCWFGGQVINSVRTSETHTVEVSKHATGKATLVYSSLMSPATNSSNNFLLASYNNGVMSEAAQGQAAGGLSNHIVYTRAFHRQALQLPTPGEATSFDITFTVHPSASVMENGAMLDFFGLLYNRRNNAEGEAQLHMYFENKDAAKIFSLEGAVGDDWHVWNVNAPMAPVEINMLEADGTKYGRIAKASTNIPNEVIAFNAAARQLKPEIIGAVENQDLHSMDVPELVIVTSKLLIPSAEKIAALHKRLQGLEVAVVDQQKIFNEYASGNTSAEGVRRFMGHLYSKDSERLKGLLLLGPATYNQASAISDDTDNVITAECELYVAACRETTAYASDTFFGRFKSLISTGNWSSRGAQLQIMATEPDIAIGRVPLSSASEIDAYYKKVEHYLLHSDNYGGLGNVLLASDYSTENEEHHLSNAEAVADAFGEQGGKSITIHRAAANLLTAAQSKVVKSVISSTISRGTSFFAYFGHGNPKNIAGSGSRPFFFDLSSSETLMNTGKYPIVYFGSCNVGPYDRTSKSLSNNFLKNENGGAITVISSCREVFQNMNQNLCEYLVKRLLSTADGELLGNIWCKAQYQAINVKNATRDNIINHITYNYFGDPMLPYRGATHSVALNAPESVVMTDNNILSGSVTLPDGTVDESFNGMVKVLLYEVPETKKNVLQNVSSTQYIYYPSVTTDQEVIGEATGNVVNGHFEVSYIGPTSTKTGTHRIQAYAYSTDGSSRGLGYIDGVSFTDPDGEVTLPDSEPTDIRSFHFADNALEAEIYIPSGIAQHTSLKSPIHLTIDGQSISHVQNFASHEEGNICRIVYPLTGMTHGRHTAELSLLDNRGEWSAAECEFGTTVIPTSNLSAAVDGSEVSFEVTTSLGSDSEKRLIIERLNGDIALSQQITVSNPTVKLPAGAYRAYVQLQSRNSASSTPKIEIFID